MAEATVGAWLACVTVTLTVAEMVWLVGVVASVATTVNVCTPADKSDIVAVLPFGRIVLVAGPMKA